MSQFVFKMSTIC